MNSEIKPVGTEAVEESALVTGLERQLAISHWLLSATKDREEARRQWQMPGGVALLPCGTVFSAIRIPAHLVWAASGSEELKPTDDFLREYFDNGAVIMDLHGLWYYALVPASASSQWNEGQSPRVKCHGRGDYLCVPALTHTEPGGPAYWSVPMDSPAELTYLDEVEQLVRQGRAARWQRTGGIR